jgi:DNA-binding MarR family transcriptional regulator
VKTVKDKNLSELKEVSRQCVCFNARRAARLITRFFDDFFAGTGLEPSQFTMLVAIRLVQPAPMLKIAEVLGMDRTTFTRNLAVLRKKGLIAEVRGPDARQKLLTLTDAGQGALGRGLPRWKKAQSAVAAALGEKQMSQLANALASVQTLADKFERNVV